MIGFHTFVTLALKNYQIVDVAHCKIEFDTLDLAGSG